MPIIPVVLGQHAEEASFLWLLRDSAIYEPHYSLSDLAHLDGRVEGHIDGLRIAGAEGWEACKEALAREEAGEVFTASVLAFENGDKGRVHTVTEAGSVSPELRRGFVSALGWLPYSQAENHIRRLLDSESPALRSMGIAASAVHRQDPGRVLLESLNDPDPLLRARALKAVGELWRTDLIPVVTEHTSEEEPDCRFYAAWSAGLLGGGTALQVLGEIAESGRPEAEKACAVALRRISLADVHQALRELADYPEKQRIAAIGAGVIGDPASIPWLMRMMDVPELARVAGESFTMITGVDIAYEDLEGEWPEGFEAGPTEEPEDENVELDPDEDLPWPNPELISEWWTKNKGQFRNGTRYLLGRPISPDHLQHVLRFGFQRQRTAAALEMVILQPGQPLFEVRAPGLRQQKLLGLK